MDVPFNYEPSSAAGSVYSCRPESEFFRSISRRSSSVADTFQELESVGEVVTRFELDMTCFCEKLANLNLLLMHVETLWNDFEAFISDTNPNPSDLDVRALEFDLLSCFLNSEVRLLENQISEFQMERASMQEFLTSSGETSMEMEDMVHDSEKSLQQSMEQLLQIKARSAMFEKILSSFDGVVTRTDKDDAGVSRDNDRSEQKDKINVQAVEHQRHVLRMLEKSLERELEFEKKVNESSQIEEALTMRLQCSEEEVVAAEEETVMTLEKLYEADHTSEILMGISKELLSKIQVLQLDVKGSQGSVEAKESRGKPSIEMEKTVKSFKEQIVEAERRAEKAEAKCKLLTQTSNQLKDSSEKVALLEKKLKDAKVKLKLRKTRNSSLEDMESMVVMMLGVTEDLYSNPRFQ